MLGLFFILHAAHPCYDIILRYFQGFEMSLQKSASVYNLLNSVLRYYLWLALSCYAEKEDVLFFIPTSGDTSCSHRGNTDSVHYVRILPWLRSVFPDTLPQNQLLFRFFGNVSFAGAVPSFVGFR